jgi:hypothetical protein
MTRKELAQALREDAQRCLDQTSDEQLIDEINSCWECGGWILTPSQLAAIIAQAEDLAEFHALFDEAHEAEEEGHEWN